MFRYVKFTKVKDEFTTHEFRGDKETIKVNYFDKDIVSLEAENEVEIDALISSQKAEIGCKVISQDEFKEIASTTAQFARIKTQVNEKYSNEVAVLTSLYPVVERETWATQLSQAKAFKSSRDEADAPFLKTLADAESDTVESFANAIISKSDAYVAFMASKLVEKRAHEKSLMSEIGL